MNSSSWSYTCIIATLPFKKPFWAYSQYSYTLFILTELSIYTSELYSEKYNSAINKRVQCNYTRQWKLSGGNQTHCNITQQWRCKSETPKERKWKRRSKSPSWMTSWITGWNMCLCVLLQCYTPFRRGYAYRLLYTYPTYRNQSYEQKLADSDSRIPIPIMRIEIPISQEWKPPATPGHSIANCGTFISLLALFNATGTLRCTFKICGTSVEQFIFYEF